MEVISCLNPSKLPEADNILEWRDYVDVMGEAISQDLVGILISSLYFLPLPKRPGVPFLFIGHSMGALMAWLVIGWLRERCQPLPFYFLVCAKESPLRQNTEHNYEKGLAASFEDWKHQYLARFGTHLGDGVRKNDVLLADIVKSFMVDARVHDSWSARLCPRPDYLKPLPVPMVIVVGGADDLVDSKDAQAWMELSSQNTSFVEVANGRHLFIQEKEGRSAVMRIVRDLLDDSIQ